MSDVNNAAGTDWLGWSQMIGTGLQGIGSIMGARAAKKNYKLNAEAFRFNKEMQSATSLANIQNRIKQYQGLDPNANVGHLQSLAQRLQSYLPNQNPAPNQGQQPMATANPQFMAMQAPNQQQQLMQQQQPSQQGNFNTLSQYGQRG